MFEWGLLMASQKHCKALLDALNGKEVPIETTPQEVLFLMSVEGIGSTHGKYSFVSHTKTHSGIWMGLLHSCEITCNIWVLETKNERAYLDAVKFKTNEDWTWDAFQSSLQFHNVPKMCGLSINSIHICSRE